MRDNADYYTAKARPSQFPAPARFSPFELACLPIHGTTSFITLHIILSQILPLTWSPAMTEEQSRFEIRQTFLCIRMKTGEKTVTKTAGNGPVNGQKCGDVAY